MNPDWFKKLYFFIDPKIKSAEKELYRRISTDLESKNSNFVEDLSELEIDPLLPITYIISSDSAVDPLIRPFDKTLVVGEANMSIFGKREFSGENHPINSPMDWEKYLSNANDVYGKQLAFASESLIENSLGFFRKLVKRGKNFEFTKKDKDFSFLEEELLGALSIAEVAELLYKISRERFSTAIYLLNTAEVYRNFEQCLPFMPSGNRYLCWEGDIDDSLILKVYSLVEDILGRASDEAAKTEHLEEMQEILSEIPVALALFDSNNELALHNARFARLNLSARKVLGLENDEQFSQNGELYRAYKRKLDKGYELSTFLPVKEFLGDSSSPSSEELGIISSSIAHELNNPLGGISGALDVMLLDDRPEELEQQLRDMKGGVARCKKLVETFLGFSRLKAKEAGEEEELESCLTSAMELIRFRLIENNVTMETHYSKSESFGSGFNPHVMAMTLYLTLGDLLTNFGHQNLVAGERSTCLKINFEESSKTLGLVSPIGLNSDFLKSKLLGHLLELQKMELVAKKDKIELRAL